MSASARRAALLLFRPQIQTSTHANTFSGIKTVSPTSAFSGTRSLSGKSLQAKFLSQHDIDEQTPGKRTFSQLTYYLMAASSAVAIYYVDYAINGPAITEYAYLDIGIGEERAGRVVLGLYGRDNPNTVQNFRGLATHENGFGYRGSPFHEIHRNFVIMGGDIVNGDGTGGSALHGPTTYSENRNLQHSRGTISMIVDDNWEIRSQFFITAMVVPSLVKKCVAFGRVLSGMEVVDAVMRVKVDDQFRPLVKPRIIDCGTLTKEEALAPRPTHDRMLEGELSGSSTGRGAPSTWQEQEQEQEQQRRKQQQQEQQQQPQPL